MPLIAYHSTDEMEGKECWWSAVMHLVSINAWWWLYVCGIPFIYHYLLEYANLKFSLAERRKSCIEDDKITKKSCFLLK